MGLSSRLQSASFRPLQGEPTPNYRGAGFQINGGYSFGDVFDIELYGSYSPLKPGSMGLFVEKVRYLEYGGGMGTRLAKSVYLGVHFGGCTYKLMEAAASSEELEGEWQGVVGQLSLGAFHQLSPTRRIQMTFDVGSATLSPDNSEAGAGRGERKFDNISLSVSYQFLADIRIRFYSLIKMGFID
jgi:hypothetical protein